MRALSMAPGVLFGVVWIGGWTAGTAWFDFVLVSRMSVQLAALGYPSAEGEGVESRVKAGRDSDGDPTHEPIVRYVYEVEGEAYEGRSVRRSASDTGRRSWARSIVERYPLGAKVDVRYDPGDPTVAVLEAGIGGDHLFMATFLTPFNIIMLGSWVVAIMTLQQSGSHTGPAAAMQRWVRPASPLRVDHMPPWVWVLIVVMGGTFVSVFLMGIPWNGNPPLRVVLADWGAIAAVAFWLAQRQARRVRSGYFDVRVDERERTVTMPFAGPRRRPLEIAIDAIESVELDERTTTDSEGDRTIRIGPKVVYREASGRERVARCLGWSEREDGERVVEALTEAWARLRR